MDGIVLSSDAAVLDLLAAATPPGGGTVAVDLLQPLQPHTLVLGPDQLAAPAVAQLADRFAASLRGDGPAPALPRDWLRLCIVAGVDRWSSTPLDARLLQVDHALARAEAGDVDTARRLYAAAAPALAELQQTTGSDVVVAELRRVRRALGPWPGTTRGGGLTRGTATLPRLGAVSAGGPTLLLGGGTDDGAGELAALVIDPLQMSPRLLLGPARYELRPDGVVDVRCSAFPGVTAGSPGADRLLVRAARTQSDGAAPVVALAPFTLAEGSADFVGSVALGGRRPDGIAVDVVDAARTTDPRSSTAALTRVDALYRAQLAFVAVREHLATRLLAPAAIVDGARFAALLLAPHAGSSPAADAFCATLRTPGWAAAPAFADDGVRPLLAELAALEPR